MKNHHHSSHHCGSHRQGQSLKCCCMDKPTDQQDQKHMKECVKMLREKADLIEKNLTS